LKLFQKWGKVGIKEKIGWDEFKFDIFDIVRTFVNTTMYLQYSNKKIKKGISEDTTM
jgi:hypothetical protein